MKIGQVSQCYKPIVGGQEVYIQNLNAVLSARGRNKITVFQSYRKISGDKSDVKLVFRFPFLASLFRSPFVHKYQYAFFLWLTRYRQLQSQDVLIVHYAFNSLLLGGLARKTIVLSHGVEWYPDRPTLNNRLHRWIAARSLNNHVVVANDTHYFRELGLTIRPKENFFKEVEPGKWFIPNCVDVNHFRRSEPLPAFAGRKIILVPRQITEDRGIDLAISAFHLLYQHLPDYEMLIVGTPTKGAYYDHCTRLIERYSLQKAVRFEGYVQNKEMVGYYTSAFLTLIPTLRREGTSLSALESMSCGTATVSTNVAGLADLPTVQAEPTAEDLFKKMLTTIQNITCIAKQQETETRAVFNLDNWGAAWKKVLDRFAKN